ncbi:YeiH family protein [Pseudaestuariivita rosea]|uniref:YeiH family protein n=1 Tax=Pseudaestuariivita rosea TaxID=2763263 RepID=UPI003013BB2A
MITAYFAKIRGFLPGVAFAGVIALAAHALSSHYGAPAMLFALLLGMIFFHLSSDARIAPGIGFASRDLLRLGVGLLGLRLSFEDIASLGWAPVLAVIALVACTTVIGVVLAVALGRTKSFGILAGGAVAICGASAALAIAAVLGSKRAPERDVLFTVAGVTTLSTLAMILYPVLFSVMEHSPREAGFLIGATIHDVAQVVGAGYSMGEQTGDIATFVKLQRVALLPVVLFALVLLMRNKDGGKGGIGLPWFLVLFIVLMLANNLLSLPVWLTDFVRTVSGALLLVAIAALGVKTSLAEMAKLGPRAAFILVATTVFLLIAAIGAEIVVS